jgi:hypothetical protein
MRTIRSLLSPVLLALLAAGCARGAPAVAAGGGDPPAVAGDADEVLVAGDPPLTRRLRDGYRRAHEWWLDVRLTEPQRRRWEELFLPAFKKKDAAQQRQLVANWQVMARYAEGLPGRGDGGRGWERLAKRAEALAGLRKSADPDDKLLLATYEAEHRPGGPKNPVLVPGDPPLTQAHLDRRTLFVEWLLDLELTEAQRREYQKLFAKEWQKGDAAKRRENLKVIEVFATKLPAMSPIKRHQTRAVFQPKYLTAWDKPGGDEDDRWLLALYRPAHRPGGPRNPVLAAGDPPLTGDLVERYADYVEWAFDLSVSGGLSRAQRDELRRYLVKDWGQAGRAAKDEVLAGLKKWDEIVRVEPKEWDRMRGAVRAQLLARLRLTKDERGLWLLNVYNREEEAVALRMHAERARQGITMQAIRAMAAERGHYDYNAATGRYDRWVPDR